jgi:two-component system, OmpR family, alkaline phosphatase synthesis response regulator PhoP
MKTRILIVEDELDLLNLYRNILTKEGFDVVTATDGKEGVAAALEKNPSVILLDILLPEMDGIHVLRELRSKGSAAKVIILTASPTLRVHEGVELGIHAYLNKAVSTPREILELIRTATKSS